jgi:hypothetical protein
MVWYLALWQIKPLWLYHFGWGFNICLAIPLIWINNWVTDLIQQDLQEIIPNLGTRVAKLKVTVFGV